MRTNASRAGAMALALLLLTGCELIITAAPSPALAAEAAPSIPDTPAGRALASWLDAFNSGNRRRIESFDAIHYPWADPGNMLALRAHTGGYALQGVDQSGRLWITFRVVERAGGSQMAGKLVIDPADPQLIWALALAPAAAGAAAGTLDSAERDRVLESAARLLQELYVFPDVGKRLAAALRSAQRDGKYRAITDGQIFAWRLDGDMQRIAHDEHLGIRFSRQALRLPAPAGRGGDAAGRRRLLAGNCGFEKAEHLPPNIGYLKLDEFDDAGTCAPTAAAAMSFVANSDALIIDLRDNHGGGGDLTLILSYLFPEPTHFMDTYVRSDHTLHESWTLARVPGQRFIGKPVLVLTSRRTFSAAEAFCYALKTLHRATLVGETTGGGAHPMQVRRIDDHFSISVPIGQSISPITHTDWEGTGVEPDFEVPAARALTYALQRARSMTP